MSIEEHVAGAKDAKTPEELLKLLPNVKPSSTEHFQECRDWQTGELMEGVFRVNPEWMKSLPEFQWDIMYELTGRMPKKPKRK